MQQHTPAKLEIPTLRVKEEGEPIAGELAAVGLDLPDDERQTCPNPLRYDLEVARVGEAILVRGTLTIVLRCRCDRCLVYYDQPVAVPEVCEFFEPPVPDVLDLTPSLREDILINFPAKYLCREDCRGLCPTCGANLNVRECHCARAETATSIWDQLDGLHL